MANLITVVIFSVVAIFILEIVVVDGQEIDDNVQLVRVKRQMSGGQMRPMVVGPRRGARVIVIRRPVQSGQPAPPAQPQKKKKRRPKSRPAPPPGEEPAEESTTEAPAEEPEPTTEEEVTTAEPETTTSGCSPEEYREKCVSSQQTGDCRN